MNKIISTKERNLISLVGASGSGKIHLIFDWLKTVTFQPTSIRQNDEENHERKS